jgi:hypothetical protein
MRFHLSLRSSGCRAASLLGLTACMAVGSPITIFNTGVNNSGNVLAGGSVDPHYAGVSPASTAFVLGGTAFLPGAWLPNSAASKWIGVDTGDGGSINGGNYARTYRITFDLTGLIPATAQLTGRWAVDNTGVLLLNGTTISTSTGFSSFTTFSATSGFLPGVNTLDAVWTNAGGPGGLRMEVSGTASAIPEPGSMLLISGGGLLFLAGVWSQQRSRRRRKH